jgi:hypothetical protein
MHGAPENMIPRTVRSIRSTFVSAYLCVVEKEEFIARQQRVSMASWFRLLERPHCNVAAA